MKKGLKLISLLFVCLFMVAATACGNSDKSKKDASNNVQEDVMPTTLKGKSLRGACVGPDGKTVYMIVDFTDDSNWVSQGYVNEEYKNKSRAGTTYGTYSITDDTLNFIMTQFNIILKGKITAAGDVISVTFDKSQFFVGSIMTF